MVLSCNRATLIHFNVFLFPLSTIQLLRYPPILMETRCCAGPGSRLSLHVFEDSFIPNGFGHVHVLLFGWKKPFKPESNHGLKPLEISKISQPASTIINNHQASSTIINYHRISSTIINYHHLSSTITNYHQFSSTFINYHQLSSTITKCHKLSPSITNFHQLSATINNYHQLSSTCINHEQ